jgi:hypothetical protein
VFFPCQRVGQVLGDEITEAQTFVQLADQNQATIGGDPRLAPLLPRMQIKPRTVSACRFVTAIISASVAPLARFIIAITSAFLLAVRFRFGSRLVGPDRLLGGLGFLGGRALRLRLRYFRRRCVLFRFSRAVHFVSPDRGCGRHMDHSDSEKLQAESWLIRPGRGG